MYIQHPKRTLRATSRDDGHTLLMLARNISEFYSENSAADPSAAQWEEAADFLAEITGIAFTGKRLKEIAALYPHSRIKLAINGIEDIDTKQGLAFLAAHFFLGCSWPTFNDRVEMSVFIRRLREQARQMGFQLSSVHIFYMCAASA